MPRLRPESRRRRCRPSAGYEAESHEGGAAYHDQLMAIPARMQLFRECRERLIRAARIVEREFHRLGLRW
jgi:hypothetical protein